MASRTIATILSMRDQFTAPMRRATESTKNMQRQLRHTQNSIRQFGSSVATTAINVVKNTATIAGAFASMTAGLAIKEGFGEAINLEGYKTQLETATKDTVKAGEIMKYAVDLANSTPFETGSMVEASAKLEAMGLSAKKYLPGIADMAGATNKSLDQANEAVIDAQAGELERLKEFGITKQMIIDHGNKIMKGKQLVNNKGQIVDQENFNRTLFDLMETKFKGGAEKQSKTFKGMWSTVTGVTKTALASIVGMQKDGTIRQGSMYEMLKGKIQTVADTLQRWQQDGTIQKITQNVNTAVSGSIEVIKEMWSVAKSTYNFIKDNWSLIAPVVGTITVALVSYKIAMIASKTYTALATAATFVHTSVLAGGASAVNLITIAQWAWNAALTANPIGLVIGTIAALGIGIYALYKNFDKVTGAIKKAWGWLKKVTGFSKEVNITTTETTKSSSSSSPPRHALGTTYFAGGLTGFSEGGRAESAIFPSGTTIIPKTKTDKLLSNSNKQINLNIKIDTFIGTEEFADMIGDKVNRKISLALNNMA
jgi:hypothetical protein